MRHGQPQRPVLAFKMRSWFYGTPGVQVQSNKNLAKFIERRLPVEWDVCSVPDILSLPRVKLSGPKVFTPLEVAFTTGIDEQLAMNPTAKQSYALEKFDVLFNHLARIIKHKKIKQVLEMEKTTVLCWSLFDRDAPNAPRLSRWVLPVPEKPIYFPAERIEQVLYNLVSIKIRQKENAHESCGGGAVLSCIENQLYRQKQAYDNLLTNLTKLSKLERESSTTNSVDMAMMIGKTIASIEEIDLALMTLVNMFQQYIGRAPPSKSRWVVVRKIKSIFKRRLAVVAIDDENIEKRKKGTRTELATFQRIAPILAAHVRLRDCDRKDELKRVCDVAEDGPEKAEMPEKLAITPALLSHGPTQEQQLARVRKHYEETYTRVLADIEALNKAVGHEYAEKGDALFKLRSKWKWDRLWKSKRRGTGKLGRCCCVEAKATKMVWEEVDEKCGWRTSSDSGISWNEKVEPVSVF